MDGNILIPQRTSVITRHDMPRQNTLIEDQLRVCPLCKSEVRLFYINLNEKLMMCVNTACEYPFGHDVLEFVMEATGAESNEQMMSPRRSSSTSVSLVSAAAWSEIDKITRMCDAEDNQLQLMSLKQTEAENKMALINKQKEKEIQKHIADVKRLNKELIEQSTDNKVVRLNNRKWIKNLSDLQEVSGVQMLSPEEISLLKKEPNLGMGELKIDIDRSDSTIRIEIVNTAQAGPDGNKEAGAVTNEK